MWEPPFKPFYTAYGVIGDNTPPYLFHIANYETDAPSALAFIKHIHEEQILFYNDYVGAH